MNIYALICTRSHKPGKTLKKIVNFYKYCGIHTILLEDKNSIFEAYNQGFHMQHPLHRFWKLHAQALFL